MRLTGRDVVRHRIVQDIVDAYERNDEPIAVADGPTYPGERRCTAPGRGADDEPPPTRVGIRGVDAPRTSAPW